MVPRRLIWIRDAIEHRTLTPSTSPNAEDGTRVLSRFPQPRATGRGAAACACVRRIRARATGDGATAATTAPTGESTTETEPPGEGGQFQRALSPIPSRI